MKANFELTLTGKDWWKPFLGFWIPFLLVYALQLRLQRWDIAVTGRVGLYFLASLVIMVLIVILQSFLIIIFLRVMMPKLSIGGKTFGFNGKAGKYIGLNLLGILLSIVTLTIYIPWYVRRIAAYLVSETTYDGAAPEFLGKGGRLFKYLLFCLYIPIIVLCVIIGLAVGLSALGGSTYGSYPEGAQLITMLLTFALVFVIMAPLCYLMYKWYVNLRWKDVTITWKTSFWPSVGLILGQLLLTIITVGIYWPAAFLKTYRYFTAKTVLSRGETEIGRLGFEGVKGFGLLWGQTLLSIITLGIYLPWAYANVGRWLLSATYCETTGQGA
jgi:uncharacterized membrane protein YjgN (DUF898 family)